MSPRSILFGTALLVLAGAFGVRQAKKGAEPDGAVRPKGSPSSWTAELTSEGTFLVRNQATDVVRARWVFWGKDYAFADPEVELSDGEAKAGPPREERYRLQVPALGLAGAGRVTAEERVVVYELRLEAERERSGIVGGGLEMELALEPGVLGEREPRAQLLPGKRGFRLPVGAGAEAVVVEADPPFADVHFEGEGQGRLRAFLFGSKLAAGARSWRLTVRLPPGGRILPALVRRYGTASGAWPIDTLRWDRWPVDLAFLNARDKPAGARGRIQARGDKLVYPDGAEARLWGTNVAAYALFSGDREAVRQQARRLAAFGYNLVRLHHHDASWVEPNVFDLSSGTTRRLRPEALASLDWWVKCLNDEGIYVWLDLHVGRAFLPGDRFAGVEEAGGQGEGKGFTFVNPEIEKLMQEFAEQYLDRKDSVTGQKVMDNPGLLAVLVTNENDLNTHFASRMYPGEGHPRHQALFERAVAASAARLRQGPIAADETWAPGPGRMILADLEAGFFARAREHLRRRGVRALIAVGNFWGEEPWTALPSLALGDLIDVHSYAQPEFLSDNPRHGASFLAQIAAAQVAGKPLTVSEWSMEMNHPDPRDRFTTPLAVAAVGALQGWDALLHYANLHGGIGEPERAETWAAGIDPAFMALMPAAAMIFREGHVRPAERTYHVRLNEADLYARPRDPARSPAIRTLTEQSRVAVVLPDAEALPWDRPPVVAERPTAMISADRDFLGPAATRVVSDTGELTRDWVSGIQLVDTPRSQAAIGWIGGRTLSLRDVELRIETPKAGVALTSLDGKPLRASRRILLSVVGQARPGAGGRLPFRAEPVRGTLRLRTESAGVRLVALGPDGTSGQPQALAVREGMTRIVLPMGHTHWYLLTPTVDPR